MARGGGRGRGNGPRGGGTTRGGRGGSHSWGAGRRLDENTGEATNGSPSPPGRGGRGRGRGATRGVGLRASQQHAVAFDYCTPLRSGNQSPMNLQTNAVTGIAEDDDDVDIVLETHKSYTHTVKPHLEAEEPTRSAADSGNNTPLLPPSVSDMFARAPSNAFAHQRAQRAMQGQVSGLIPTGPKSAHIHRMYGTLDIVHTLKSDRRRQQQQQHEHQQRQQQLNFPLPVSSTPSGRASKKERPPEANASDPCLAGIPRPGYKLLEKDRFLGRGAQSGLLIPVRFEKASGEWKNGAWIRSSDGKELVTTESTREAGQPSDSFERASGAGLGFHQKGKMAAAPLPDDLWAEEREDHDEEDDPIAALLKSHPGSKEMDEEEDDTFGYYRDQSLTVNGQSVHRTSEQSPREMDMKIDKGAEGNPQEGDADSDDEDVILIPHVQCSAGPALQAQSDSEEERQLDKIISREKDRASREGVNVAQIEEEPSMEESGFYIDLTGVAEQQTTEAVVYQTSHTDILGEASAPVQQIENSEDEELDPVLQRVRGNGKKARNAAKKARRRSKKQSGQSGQSFEPKIAREGDSDLDWGSDGPPLRFRKPADQETFDQGDALRHLHLDDSSVPRSSVEEDEMLAIALANSIEQQNRLAAKPKKKGRQSERDAIVADYLENAIGAQSNDSESDGEDMVIEQRDESKGNETTDLDAMLRFMSGMDGQRNGREMTMEDIAIEKQMNEEEQWMTESNDEEADSDNEKDFDVAVEKDEKKLIAEEPDVQSDSDSSSDEDQVANRSGRAAKQRRRGQHDSDDSDSTSDDDSEDDVDASFDRHFTWAEADEDFIARLDKFAQAHDGILKGRDRKARNKLFKMIESGDFGDVADDDMLLDGDDPVFGLRTLQPAKKGKKAQKPWSENNLWAEQLQLQWEKDRSTKAQNKRKRAAERAAAAADPFHATQIKKGTKKMAKKAARAERRAARSSTGGRIVTTGYFEIDDDDDDDDEDRDDFNFSKRSSHHPLASHATNMFELDRQIQLFLREPGKTTLSLAPMDKRARAQVHLLANCYNLTSKSKGNGNKRFPTLIKNQRSGYNVNHGKIRGIISRSQGSFGSGARDSADRSGKVKDRASGAGAHVPKNQEGAAVGFGAERIGEENIGHRLLTMMGWSEGSGVGLTKGSADPVGATIKVTKSGLGF